MDFRTDTTINGQPILHQGNHGNVKWPHKYQVPLNSPYITQKISNTSNATPYLRIFSFQVPITTNRAIYEIGFRVTNISSFDWGSIAGFDFLLKCIFTSPTTVLYCNLYAKELTTAGIASSILNHYVIVTKDSNNYTFDVYFNIRESNAQLQLVPLFTNEDKMLECFLTDEQAKSLTDLSTLQSAAFMNVTSIFDVMTRGQLYAKGNVVTEKAICPIATATANRPTGIPTGGMIFDTTLGKPIWSKQPANQWVDSTGTLV